MSIHATVRGMGPTLCIGRPGFGCGEAGVDTDRGRRRRPTPEGAVRPEETGRAGRQIAEAHEADVDLPLQSFPDLEANLIQQVERILSHPWVKDVPVHSLVYDVETGRLRPIT